MIDGRWTMIDGLRVVILSEAREAGAVEGMP
jgi:hypothetical protein